MSTWTQGTCTDVCGSAICIAVGAPLQFNPARSTRAGAWTLARKRLRQAGDVTWLDTTALLHESFLRLRSAAPPDSPDPQRFLACAAKAMRSVVVDLERSRQTERHGGGLDRVTWHTDAAGDTRRPADEVLRVNEALEDLARLEPRLATVVELRHFGGLTEAETAAMLDIKLRTVQRDWAKAGLFLSLEVRP